jgi:hypothetical protein
MPCRDKAIDYLRQYGYNVVRLPKAEFPPLTLLSGDSRELDRFGHVTTVFVGDGTVPVPAVTTGSPTANVSGQSSAQLKVGLGLSVLSGIISAMGGSSLGLKAAYSRAATVSFELSEVTESTIELAALDRYLAASDVDPYAPTAAELLERDSLFVVTAALQSSKIKVSAKTSSSESLSLDVPALQGAIGANVSVSSNSQSDSMITYAGKTPLVFGFQAVQVFYEDGFFHSFEPRHDLTSRALSDVPLDRAKRYLATPPLLRVND